jgi:hypothetical protein
VLNHVLKRQPADAPDRQQPLEISLVLYRHSGLRTE